MGRNVGAVVSFVVGAKVGKGLGLVVVGNGVGEVEGAYVGTRVALIKLGGKVTFVDWGISDSTCNILSK